MNMRKFTLINTLLLFFFSLIIFLSLVLLVLAYVIFS